MEELIESPRVLEMRKMTYKHKYENKIVLIGTIIAKLFLVIHLGVDYVVYKNDHISKNGASFS